MVMHALLIGEEMFALLSLPYVYPYGYIVGPLMIAALAVSITLFVGSPVGLWEMFLCGVLLI